MEEIIRKALKLDDTVDVKALIDTSLNVQENITNIKEQLSLPSADSMKNIIDRDKYLMDTQQESEDVDFKKFVNFKSIIVLGGSGSGKTSLGWKIISEIKTIKKVYVFNHPKPKLIQKLGYSILYSLDQVQELKDCFVWIDEPQLLIPTKHRRLNEDLLRLLSIARQKNINMMFTTNDSRWLNKGFESYIDCFIIKDIDYETLKQGSLARKIIQNACYFDPESFHLPIDTFLIRARSIPELSGKHTFKEVNFFSKELSNSFA